MAPSTALIIIFNHRYDKNIEILERIYKDRFSNIYFLVPFYDGQKENVIPVFGNSYYYSSYIGQAYRHFHTKDYTRYLFIADDMALNPVINENNLHEYLGTTEGACFIPEIRSLHNIQDYWHTHSASVFKLDPWGIEAAAELPSFEQALDAFNRHNIELRPLMASQIFEPERLIKKAVRYLNILLRQEKKRQEIYHLNYPQVGGFCDFFLVSHDAIQKFSHYCGVLGAMQLFVELAIPTAMMLSASKICLEDNLEYKGKYLWTSEELNQLSEYNMDLNKLFAHFPEHCLFIHPVKLSRWRYI